MRTSKSDIKKASLAGGHWLRAAGGGRRVGGPHSCAPAHAQHAHTHARTRLVYRARSLITPPAVSRLPAAPLARLHSNTNYISFYQMKLIEATSKLACAARPVPSRLAPSRPVGPLFYTCEDHDIIIHYLLSRYK